MLCYATILFKRWSIGNFQFAGFSSDSLAERMSDCKAKVLVTADGAWRGTKLLNLKDTCDDAMEKAKTKYNHTVNMCIVVPHLERVTACGKLPHDLRDLVSVAWFNDVLTLFISEH